MDSKVIASKSRHELIVKALNYYEKILRQKFERRLDGVTKLDVLPDIASAWLEAEYANIKRTKKEIGELGLVADKSSFLHKLEAHQKIILQSALDEYSWGLSELSKTVCTPSGKRADKELVQEEKLAFPLFPPL